MFIYANVINLKISIKPFNKWRFLYFLSWGSKVRNSKILSVLRIKKKKKNSIRTNCLRLFLIKLSCVWYLHIQAHGQTHRHENRQINTFLKSLFSTFQTFFNTMSKKKKKKKKIKIFAWIQFKIYFSQECANVHPIQLIYIWL